MASRQTFQTTVPNAGRTPQQTDNDVHKAHRRHPLLALFITLVVVSLFLLSAPIGEAGVAHAASRPAPHGHGKVIGSERHITRQGGSPDFTILCNIHDITQKRDSNHLGVRVYIECGGVAANIMQVSVWLEACLYWNYAQNNCPGGWTQYGNAVAGCSAVNTYYLYCPNGNPTYTYVGSGETVQVNAYWTTDISGNTSSQTNYGSVWHF